MTTTSRSHEVVELTADVSDSPLWNPDLAPTTLSQRTWSTYHIAALWIGMSVVITTYTLASGLMQQGMTWWQAMVTILLGNTVVLVPMMLNAHAGTKYGVSFPVLCRASFGVRGANVPAILRALVACGWFGIQTWIGGLALNTLLTAAWPAWGGFGSVTVWISFAAFWLVQVAIIVRGLEGIKKLESWSAPLLLVGRCAAADVGGATRRRPRAHPRGVEPSPVGPRAVLAAVPGGADRKRRLLGDALPQHSGLHALRAKPEIAGARPGARPAGHDDRVRLHRRRRHQRDDRHLRRSDLGSGRADRAHRQPRW